MIIDQKNIVIGVIVSIILIIVFGYIIPSIGTYLGYSISSIGIYLAPIIACAFIGYRVNNDIKYGMIHGGIIGLFSGIAVVAIYYLRIAGNPKLTGILLILGLWSMGVFIILGLVGGAIGYLIKQRSKNNMSKTLP